jgi:hypothetical protein
MENLKNEAQLKKGMILLSLKQSLQQTPKSPEKEQLQQELKKLQTELWDDGIISEWIMRSDTECIYYSNGKYNMYIWLNVDPESVLNEVSLCFRILEFIGASPGFCVNWWRIPISRNVAPNVFPTRSEVNGGWTRSGTNEVFIYRFEEWDRVLIHECIHALSWDVSPTLSLKKCLEHSLGGGKLMDALFEAATELNAEWLWCIIHSPHGDNKGNTWLKQTNWQKKQAYAILARSDMVWNEDTSVFAYYIMKTVLALDMERFLINWLSNSENTDTWCFLWNKYKPLFLHNAHLNKHTVDTNISMRMTNPELE